MKALILAAGKGSRLGVETEDKPKALVKINGKPILQYQLEALLACKIKNIIIIIGYKGNKIKKFIEEIKLEDRFKDLNIRLIENKNYDKTNSAYSFFLAKNEINDSYIHLNCDIIFFPGLLKNLIDSKYENVIIIDRKIDLTDNMEQVIMNKDKIVRMRNTLLNRAIGKAVGIAKLSPTNISWIKDRISNCINKGDKNQNFYGIIRSAVEHLDFYGLDSKNEFIYEINTTSDLKKGRDLLNKSQQNL